VINATVTEDIIQRQLFSYNAKIAFTALYYNSPDSRQAVGFFLDPLWDRIVYSKEEATWVYAYGEAPNHYSMASARAMTIDVSPANYVYVADTESGRMLKLRYGEGALGIEGSFAFNVPGVEHPVDVCLPCMGEGIWIADDLTGRLVEVTRGAVPVTVLNTIEHYTIGGQTFRLSSPRSVAAVSSSLGNRLAFIDGVQNVFVVCAISGISGNAVEAINATKLSTAGTHLQSIGTDAINSWWLADPSLSLVHTFDWDGEYLASVATPGRVAEVSVTPCYNDGGNPMEPLEFFTAEPWTRAEGLRAYLPGADALDLRADDAGDEFVFSCVLTNACEINTKIVRCSDGALVQNVYSGNCLATPVYDETAAKSSLPLGSYRYRVEVRPLYNAQYDVNAVDWLVREVPFSNLAAPSGVVATAHPSSGRLAWNSVPGAGTYSVYRDGTLAASYLTTTTYWDFFRPPVPAAYSVQAADGCGAGAASAPLSIQPLHLQTSDPTSLAANGQRKFAADDFEGQNRSALVFQSGGEVWLTTRVGGGTFVREMRLSSGQGGFSSPSIVLTNGSMEPILGIESEGGGEEPIGCYAVPQNAVVYQRLVGTSREIWFRDQRGVPFNLWDPVLLGTSGEDARPVVARRGGLVDGPHLLAVWQQSGGLRSRLASLPSEAQPWAWGSLASVPPSGVSRLNPSVASAYSMYDNFYMTCDDGSDVYLYWLTRQGQWISGGAAPASLAPASSNSQIHADLHSGGAAKVHVVWEVRTEEVPPTRIGEKRDGTETTAYKVMYQRREGTNWFAALEFSLSGSTAGARRPSVSSTATGIVYVTWDDGQYTYRSTSSGSTWSFGQLEQSGSHANLVGAGPHGPTASATLFNIGALTEPFSLQESADLGEAVEVTSVPALYSRRVVAAMQPTSGSLAPALSVEIGSTVIQRVDGRRDTVSLIPMSDDSTGIDAKTALQYLRTSSIPNAAQAESAHIDITLRLQNSTSIRTGPLRIGVELLDAQTDEVIRAVGEDRVFASDTSLSIRLSAGIANSGASSVRIRPRISGLRSSLRSVTHTVVHVYELTPTHREGPSVANSVKSLHTREVPSAYCLDPSYPNPFNPSTSLVFSLPEPAHVNLEVFDMIGRSVATVFSGQCEPGYHQTTWNALGVASGVYLARFTATTGTGSVTYTKTHKLVLMK
jgi:hypothetical protein